MPKTYGRRWCAEFEEMKEGNPARTRASVIEMGLEKHTRAWTGQGMGRAC